MRTDLEVQQREDIRRDLDERKQFVLQICEQEKMCLIDEWVRAKSSMDGSLAKGSCLKLLRSGALWQLLVLALLSFQRKEANEGDFLILWIWKNFQTRVSEQEHLFYGSLAKDKQMPGKCFLVGTR